MDAAKASQSLQPYDELPTALLRLYPEVASLTHARTKQLAAAVYQLNRLAQIALAMFHRSQPVQGLSRMTVSRLLERIENGLHGLQVSSDALIGLRGRGR